MEHVWNDMFDKEDKFPPQQQTRFAVVVPSGLGNALVAGRQAGRSDRATLTHQSIPKVGLFSVEVQQQHILDNHSTP